MTFASSSWAMKGATSRTTTDSPRTRDRLLSGAMLAKAARVEPKSRACGAKMRKHACHIPQITAVVSRRQRARRWASFVKAANNHTPPPPTAYETAQKSSTKSGLTDTSSLCASSARSIEANSGADWNETREYARPMVLSSSTENASMFPMMNAAAPS